MHLLAQIIISLVLVSTTVIHASKFSLKKIVSYVVPKMQEDVVNYEAPFDADGSLIIENILGDINVNCWDDHKIVIDIVKKGTDKELPEITLQKSIDAQCANFITKQPLTNKATVTYNVIVPRKAKITLRTTKGNVKVSQPSGEVDAASEEGAVSLHDTKGPIFAQSLKGNITVKIKDLPHHANVTVENEDGDIDMYLSQSLNAAIHAKAPEGTVQSDLYVHLKARTTKLNKQFWDTMKRDLDATIGKGGPLLNLIAKDGDIHLLEY